MVEILEVKSKGDIKEFIELPLKMYKKCPQYVPALYSDEVKMLTSGGKTNEYESVFYLAKKDGYTVGRIQGVLHNRCNEIKNEKRVRFTRFDSIDDKEVSNALFSAVEDWARERGMTSVCGPLGCSILARDGLLVWGFDENCNYGGQYNYEYYGELIESYGFKKEADWVEFELSAFEKKDKKLEMIAKRAMELNKLHIADSSISKNEYINKYAKSFFETIDACYRDLYGTVPISEEQRAEMMKQFYKAVDSDRMIFICNKRDEVVACGIAFPAIGDAIKKSGGKKTPFTLLKLKRAIKKPRVLDLGMIAIRPEYQNAGIGAIIINALADLLTVGRIERCETNLVLETNTQLIAQWKYLNSRYHRRRRAYVKNISREKNDA